MQNQRRLRHSILIVLKTYAKSKALKHSILIVLKTYAKSKALKHSTLTVLKTYAKSKAAEALEAPVTITHSPNWLIQIVLLFQDEQKQKEHSPLIDLSNKLSR
jgi:hypothetical protein